MQLNNEKSAKNAKSYTVIFWLVSMCHSPLGKEQKLFTLHFLFEPSDAPLSHPLLTSFFFFLIYIETSPLLCCFSFVLLSSLYKSLNAAASTVHKKCDDRSVTILNRNEMVIYRKKNTINYEE